MRDLTARLSGPDDLIERPLPDVMQPQPGGAPVLLRDEIDRTDDACAAFLLDALFGDQVTIPELSAIQAATPQIGILTSNCTREGHDAQAAVPVSSGGPPSGQTRTRCSARAGRLRTVDFEKMSNDESATAQRILSRLSLPVKPIATRRPAPDPRGAFYRVIRSLGRRNLRSVRSR